MHDQPVNSQPQCIYTTGRSCSSQCEMAIQRAFCQICIAIVGCQQTMERRLNKLFAPSAPAPKYVYLVEVNRKWKRRNRKQDKSDVSHSAETVCATESKEGLSTENRNQKSIVSEPTQLQKPASPAQCLLPNYPVHLIFRIQPHHVSRAACH